MRGVWLACCLCVVAAGGGAAPAEAGQDRTPSRFRTLRPAEPVADARIHRLERWLKAVTRHQPGADDEPLREVASWTNPDLRTLWIEVNVVVKLMRNPGMGVFSLRPDGQRAPIEIRYTPPQLVRLSALACAAGGIVASRHCVDIKAATSLDADLLRLSALAGEARFHGDVNFVLRRGALLHSDVAILAPHAALEPVPLSASLGPQRLRLEISDGRDVDLGQDAVHWDIARMVLDHVQPNGADQPAPGRDAMVREWYRATASWMQHVEQHDNMHLARALEIFPTDSEIMFLSGCQHEAYASPRIQSGVQSAELPAGVSMGVGSARAELRQAEGSFRRALEIEPAHVEARLRHGRALGSLGRHLEAVGELRQVVAAAPTEPLLRYYAELFLGAEEEELGHRDAARLAYEQAAALYPDAQSPLLAISRLERSSGNRPAALRALQQVFALSPHADARDDPWWIYNTVQARNAEALLDEVRRPFHSEPQR
jgi:tetratricopeptide (TPR) repeat protein